MTSIQSVPALDRQIASAATEFLKSTVGENIARIAERVADKLDGVSVADAIRVIDTNWDRITTDAGVGPLAVTKFSGSASDTRRVDLDGTVAGQQLAGRHMKAAGTVKARKHEKGEDVVVVHGPQYWELMQHTKPFERKWLGRLFDQALSLVGLDGAREKLGYNLTRMHIDRVWSTGEKKTALRGISGTEMEAFTKPGPNGEPAALQPGDALLCGGGGDGGLTHAILYAGPAPANHPEAGKPMIIHAMATLKEGATRAEWIAGKLKGFHNQLHYDLGLKDERPDMMTGVLYERLGNFFNRYHRDSVMVVYDATLMPAQIEKGLAHARQLAGYDEATGQVDPDKRVPYDYKLAPDDLVSIPQDDDPIGRREYLAKYCTEVWLASNYVGHECDRSKLPYVGTAHYSQGSPFGTFGVHETFISEPEDLAISPDLPCRLLLGGGAHALAEALRTRIKAPIASIPRDKRPVPEPIPTE